MQRYELFLNRKFFSPFIVKNGVILDTNQSAVSVHNYFVVEHNDFSTILVSSTN